MNKKWYSYLVSVERENAAPDPGAKRDSETPDAAQTIADIAASVSTPSFQKTVADPASFDQIYAAAEIPTPAHGFTIFKIADMLKSEHIRTLPIEIKRSSVLLALDAAGVKAQDVIEDAVRRDRALDTFETVQQRALEQMEQRGAEDNNKLQQEADRVLGELRAKIQHNNEEVAKERERMQTWRRQKQQEEQRIAEAVRPFASPNPITTSAAPAPVQQNVQQDKKTG
jgi:hypothetical protein